MARNGRARSSVCRTPARPAAGRGLPRRDRSVWRQVVQSFPRPIAVIDADGGRLVAANEAFLDTVPWQDAASLMQISGLDENVLQRGGRSALPYVLSLSPTMGLVFECRRLLDSSLIALIAYASAS
jgi:hypothetical protein